MASLVDAVLDGAIIELRLEGAWSPPAPRRLRPPTSAFEFFHSPLPPAWPVDPRLFDGAERDAPRRHGLLRDRGVSFSPRLGVYTRVQGTTPALVQGRRLRFLCPQPRFAAGLEAMAHVSPVNTPCQGTTSPPIGWGEGHLHLLPGWTTPLPCEGVSLFSATTPRGGL